MIYEMKQEVGSRGEASILKGQSVIFREEVHGGWTSKCDNIKGMSIVINLKRDEIV